MRRLLVLRSDNIGDVLLFSGALRFISRRWPEYQITLAVRSHVLNLVELCPHVDRVVAYEDLVGGGGGGVDDEAGDPEYWRGGVVILPVRSPTPAMHADIRDTPAAEKYGMAGDFNNQTPEQDRAAEAWYTRRFTVPPEQRWRHELGVTADFLRFLNCDLPAGEAPAPELWTAPQDEAFAAERIPEDGRGLTIGLIPEANHPCRVWPVGNYAPVIRSLEGVGRVVILGGGENRRDLSLLRGSLEATCPGVEVVDLAGRTTLRQTAECLRRCHLLVSTETWVLHAAVALGVPAVGIMGGGHFGRFYPWGDPRRHRTAHLPLDCYHCNWRCPFPRVHCIEDIAVPSVVGQARAALAGSDPSESSVRPVVRCRGFVSIPDARRRGRATSPTPLPSREGPGEGAGLRASPTPCPLRPRGTGRGVLSEVCSLPSGSGTSTLVAFGPPLISERANQPAVGVRPARPPAPASLAGPFRKKYLRELWRRLGERGEPLAIFGAGGHTHWLLQTVWDVPGPPVVYILDDAAKPGQTLLDHPVTQPLCGRPPCRRILVSSDRLEEKLAQRCRELYGKAVEVLRLYEDLPPGPYPRS